MKTYHARVFGIVFVTEDGKRRDLCRRMDLRFYSTGFAWGCSWLAVDQLALAILCDACEDETAIRVHRQFTESAVRRRPRDEPFEMTSDEVLAHVARIEKELAA